MVVEEANHIIPTGSVLRQPCAHILGPQRLPCRRIKAEPHSMLQIIAKRRLAAKPGYRA
jgi:hypothetical protein